MQIIILGAGQVGSTLAENLSVDHDITVVDKDESRLLALQSRLDIRTVEGIAAYPDVLEAAGAEDADMLIAVTSSDETNIVACQIAYCLFKTPNKVARVRCRELSQYPELFKPGNLHIDTIINPAEWITRRLVRLVEHPGCSVILDFAEGAIQMAAVRAAPQTPLVGRRIAELTQELMDIPHCLVAIMRNHKLFLVDEDTVIEAHDEVCFCTEAKQVNAVTEVLLENNKRYRRLILVGGGNIGVNLAQALENDYNVKLLERGVKQCEEAAAILNKTVILNGDASDADLLLSENIDETDLFCSVTNDDEANIMSAIVAKRLGARNTFALVNRQTYAHYLIERSPDIDLAISPQRITSGKLLTFLRKGDMVHVYPLSKGSAEVIEIIAHGDEKTAKAIGKPIGKLHLPADAKIVAIQRGEHVIMADDAVVIEAGDHVILMVCDKSAVADIQRLFYVAPSFL